MPIKIPRSEHHTLIGRAADGNTGYNRADANATVRMALRFKHNKYRAMAVPLTAHTVKPETVRFYFYRAKQYIRDCPHLYTEEMLAIVAAMRFKIRDGQLIIDLAPRGSQLARTEADVIALAGSKGGDYKGRQLFVHWISDLHEKGEYIDIPGQFTLDDLGFFRSMGEDYKDVITVEFSADNVRVVWIADTKKGDNESPW